MPEVDGPLPSFSLLSLKDRNEEMSMLQAASGSQRGAVILPQWPEHLVPCCVDMATSRPFAHALDIIHITDYSVLDYYPIPRRFVEEVFPSAQTESVRRLSRSSISSPVQVGRSLRDRLTAAVDAIAATNSTRRVSISPLPQRIEKVEVFIRPVGQVTMSAVYSFSEPSNSGPNMCDDERLFQLQLPNQVIYLKPISNSQRSLLVKFIRKWLRIATVPYFSSRVAFLVVEFTVTTSDAVNTGHEKKRDYGADASAMQLKAAAVAIGTFSDAKHVVSENFASTPQVCLLRSVLNGGAPAERRRLVLAIPFSFGSLEMLSIGLKHETLGWLTPVQSLSLTLGHIIGQHRSSSTAYHMPLFIAGPFQGKVRSWASVWWSPDQSLNLSVAVSCKNMVRHDLSFPDPACFVSLMTLEKDEQQGVKRRRGKFLHFSEAYRNRKDSEFCPFSLSFPVDLPLEYQKSVNFVSSGGSSGGTFQPPGVERHLSRTFYHSIPVNVTERGSIVSENDQFQRIEDRSNLGNDMVFPAVTTSDMLLFEVLDGHYDVIMKDCLPAPIGTACVSIEDLLSVANEANSVPHSSALLTYGLRMHAGLQVTESTSVSTLERLREKQKAKYPMTASSFVFLTPSEATENLNSKLISEKGLSTKVGSCELGITKSALTERPTFLQFLHSNEWDFGSIICADFTPSSLRAQRRGTVSIKSCHDASAAPSEMNIFEMVIVILNRMLAPFLSRGGSDLYGFGIGQDGQTSVFPIHQYPEAFGVAVDETTAVDRRVLLSDSPQHHHHGRSGELPIKAATGKGSSTIPPYPSLRDWSGELTLPSYRTKRSTMTAKNEAAEDAAGDMLGEGCSQLCPVLRRAAQRAAALSSAREAAVDRGATSIPPLTFQVVTVLIHSNISDSVEAAHLIASWIERPLGFILVFADSAAPIVFGGVPNCATVDLVCCQPKAMFGLALHRQLRTIEDTVAKVPSLFLTFARVSGIMPSAAHEKDVDDSECEEEASAEHNQQPMADASAAVCAKDEKYKVEKRKFAASSQKFRNAFGGAQMKHDVPSMVVDPVALPQSSPLQRRFQTAPSDVQLKTATEDGGHPSLTGDAPAHARIADVYVTEDEYVLLELESMKQLARQRNAAAMSTASSAASARGRSVVGQQGRGSQPAAPLPVPVPTVLLDDALVRKHVERLMSPKNKTSRAAEVDRVVDPDDDIVAVVMGRLETLNASEVAVMLQCDAADAQLLLASAGAKIPAPPSGSPAATQQRSTSQSRLSKSATLSDIGDEEKSEGTDVSEHLSPMEKRRKRENEELQQLVEDALKPMYKGWSAGPPHEKAPSTGDDEDLLFESTCLPQKAQASKNETARSLKAVDRFHVYKSADPVTDALKYRTALMTAARTKTVSRVPVRPASARPAASVTQPSVKPAAAAENIPPSAKDKKSESDCLVQELAPEKRKRLNDLLQGDKTFHGGPILIPEVARQQQEAAELRLQQEAKARQDRMKAIVASAPQRAKERQKKLHQWRAAFRKANKVAEEDDEDVLQ